MRGWAAEVKTWLEEVRHGAAAGRLVAPVMGPWPALNVTPYFSLGLGLRGPLRTLGCRREASAPLPVWTPPSPKLACSFP